MHSVLMGDSIAQELLLPDYTPMTEEKKREYRRLYPGETTEFRVTPNGTTREANGTHSRDGHMPSTATTNSAGKTSTAANISSCQTMTTATSKAVQSTSSRSWLPYKALLFLVLVGMYLFGLVTLINLASTASGMGDVISATGIGSGIGNEEGTARGVDGPTDTTLYPNSSNSGSFLTRAAMDSTSDSTSPSSSSGSSSIFDLSSDFTLLLLSRLFHLFSLLLLLILLTLTPRSEWRTLLSSCKSILTFPWTICRSVKGGWKRWRRIGRWTYLRLLIILSQLAIAVLIARQLTSVGFLVASAGVGEPWSQRSDVTFTWGFLSESLSAWGSGSLSSSADTVEGGGGESSLGGGGGSGSGAQVLAPLLVHWSRWIWFAQIGSFAYSVLRLKNPKRGRARARERARKKASDGSVV